MTTAHKATRFLLRLYGVVVAFWLVAPALVIVPMSFVDKRSLAFPPTGFSLKWFEGFFEDPLWYESAITSLKVGLLSAAVATALGAAAALGLMRARPAIRAVVGAFFLMPMIIPLIVLAIGLYAVALQFQMTGTLIGFVLAHTVVAFPYVVTNVYAGLQQFDQRLERAAHSLGSNRIVTFFTVTLPLIMPSVLAAFLFAFVISLDEVVLSLFIADPYVNTLPVQIYTTMAQDPNPTVAATATMLLVLTTTLIVIGLFFASRGLRRRIGTGTLPARGEQRSE